MRNLIPIVSRNLRNSPALLNVTGKAAAMVRSLNIKPYLPARRTREFSACEGSPISLHACRNHLFREKGNGPNPTIIVAGFVPDATEVVEFQRPILKSSGSIYYINFSRTGFDRRLFHSQLADLVDDINARGEKPTLFGISFGAGLVTDFLQQQLVGEDAVRGVILVSPVLCTQDLVRSREDSSGGVRMLESNIRRIIKAVGEGKTDVDRQVERARRCFQSLFETGASNRRLTGRHLSIRKKIMDVIELTTTRGGYERLQALQEFSGLTSDTPLSRMPAMALVAEAEDSILVPTSPTMAILRNQTNFSKYFPGGACREIRSHDPADPVTHASLIFHHEYYNRAIRAWYARLSASDSIAI